MGGRREGEGEWRDKVWEVFFPPIMQQFQFGIVHCELYSNQINKLHLSWATIEPQLKAVLLSPAAAALLGQEIFIAGGQAEQEVINSAEVYNPELNQWEHMVARMLTPRVGLAMVSMGNLIYVIGT